MINDTLKILLVRAAKNATNAALTTLPAPFLWPGLFHFHDWQGVKHSLTLFGSAVVAKEITVVVIPLLAQGYAWLLKWSSTNGEAKP